MHSTFTLLFQSDRGGLEIYNRETGKYMPATPKNGMLYLTIGDIFMRLSNGRLFCCGQRQVTAR